MSKSLGRDESIVGARLAGEQVRNEAVVAMYLDLAPKRRSYKTYQPRRA